MAASGMAGYLEMAVMTTLEKSMDQKEQEAADALAAALAALSRAILKCGDAHLSFMNVTEPLINAHATIADVRKVVLGEA